MSISIPCDTLSVLAHTARIANLAIARLPPADRAVVTSSNAYKRVIGRARQIVSTAADIPVGVGKNPGRGQRSGDAVHKKTAERVEQRTAPVASPSQVAGGYQPEGQKKKKKNRPGSRMRRYLKEMEALESQGPSLGVARQTQQPPHKPTSAYDELLSLFADPAPQPAYDYTSGLVLSEDCFLPGPSTSWGVQTKESPPVVSNKPIDRTRTRVTEALVEQPLVDLMSFSEVVEPLQQVQTVIEPTPAPQQTTPTYALMAHSVGLPVPQKPIESRLCELGACKKTIYGLCPRCTKYSCKEHWQGGFCVVCQPKRVDHRGSKVKNPLQHVKKVVHPRQVESVEANNPEPVVPLTNQFSALEEDVEVAPRPLDPKLPPNKARQVHDVSTGGRVSYFKAFGDRAWNKGLRFDFREVHVNQALCKNCKKFTFKCCPGAAFMLTTYSATQRGVRCNLCERFLATWKNKVFCWPGDAPAPRVGLVMHKGLGLCVPPEGVMYPEGMEADKPRPLVDTVPEDITNEEGMGVKGATLGDFLPADLQPKEKKAPPPPKSGEEGDQARKLRNVEKRHGKEARKAQEAESSKPKHAEPYRIYHTDQERNEKLAKINKVLYKGEMIDPVPMDEVLEPMAGIIPPPSWRNMVDSLEYQKRHHGRRVALYADAAHVGAEYSYGKEGTVLRARMKPVWLQTAEDAVRDALEAKGVVTHAPAFGMVVVNEYAHMGGIPEHSDNETHINQAYPITSLSLGAPREFQLRNKVTGERLVVPLEHGTVVSMKPGVQDTWLHKVSPGPGRRWNITWRAWSF
ncbi:MAG: hypothetical protein FDSTV1_gp1 [Fushun diaea subdola tombus-like virus 1]|nr:MAG: hypothetical protein FDSTV1_gp1 [Fushun diaea subdola tombus-like virus 1]